MLRFFRRCNFEMVVLTSVVNDEVGALSTQCLYKEFSLDCLDWIDIVGKACCSGS